MKNNILKIFLPALSALALFSCGVTNTSSPTSTPGGNTPTPSDSSPGTAEVVNTHQLYAFEAATGLSFATELGNAQMAALGRLNAPTSEERATFINEIKDYLPTVESALLGGQELITVREEQSENPEYANKIVVSYTDLASDAESFTMYFNETLLNDDDDDDDDDWDDRWENDTETETKIEGIVTFGEESYPIRGEKEIDNDEVEVEFFYQISDNTYVQIKQEKETGETEYEYTVYERGNKVYEYSLSVEDNSVELEVKDKSTFTDLEMEFTLFERNGTTYIKADIDEGNADYDDLLFRKVVDETAGTSTYEVVE